MLSLFDSLKSIVKTKKICIDNEVFVLHYRVTVLLLIVFCILQTSTQFFGEPITCMAASKYEIKEDLLNAYCWIQSTFTLPKAHTKKVGVEVPHPGIDGSLPTDEVRYHKYYQWVCFTLFFQAILFYAPRFIWKALEHGKLENILLDLNLPILPKADFEKSLKLVIEYLEKSKGTHDFYAYQFILCEIFNFINVIGQIYFVNRFLEGEFTTYGTQVVEFLQMDQEDRVDPMIKIFPRVSRCTFHKFGPTGGIQTLEALCVLPLNIVNEKIYIFLWFWFIILSILSGLVLLNRLALIIYPLYRLKVLKIYCPTTDLKDLQEILENHKIGDWFLLLQLSKNAAPLHFADIVAELKRRKNYSRKDIKQSQENTAQGNGTDLKK